MAIHRTELLSGGKQDKNAGNSGDLGKHCAYLSLLATLRRTSPWRGALDLIEAHAGKGLYVPAHFHWRTFQEMDLEGHIPLVSAQVAVLAPAPVGVGPILDLQADEHPYAGSSLLHASVLRASPHRSLVFYDCEANVRKTLTRVFEEPCFDAIRDQVEILNPGPQGSEPVILEALRGGRYGRSHVVHLDPYSFVMGKDLRPTRDLYHDLIEECDAQVAAGRLAAATLFLTWGRFNGAARSDLFEDGYRAGLRGGLQDLRSVVRPTQRIVISWCWRLYFALIVIVPKRLRDGLVHSLKGDLAPLATRCKCLAINGVALA